MNDTQEPTQQQENIWIIEALGIAGFTYNEFIEIYTKPHGEKDQIVVDLKDGKHGIWFNIDKKAVMADDKEGILAKVADIMTDAMVGKMPTKSVPDEVVTSEREPALAHMSEIPEPIGAEPTGTDNANVPVALEPAQACAPTEPKNNILDLIQKYVGNDVLQVFGDTGAGKSKFCFEVAMQAITAGKKVYYLDTERNLTDADVAHLKGCDYHYTPVLDEIDKIVQNLPGVDVVILDSIGFPVLTTYARLSMKQKGDALLKLIAIFGDLKTWAYKNNGVAVVTNQPESEFNKEKGHIFRPFGDKSQFACKEIWKTKIKTRGASETNILIEAFRSRSVGFSTKIATMKITDAGVEVVT